MSEREFRNWSGNLRFRPATIARPGSIDEIVALVREAHTSRRRIRVVGTGHSWMPLIRTDDILVSLDNWQGIEAVDRDAGTATIRAGTKLHRVATGLHDYGLALENMGDIADQSLAGALLTGTHGTGAGLRILASQIVGAELVTGTGGLLQWHEDSHPDEMRALRVSFGALGLVTRLTLRVLPDYKLHELQVRYPLDDLFASVEQLKRDNRHVEFFWFPGTETVVLKRLNVTDDVPRTRPPVDAFLEDNAVNVVMRLAAQFPGQGGAINRAFMGLVDETSAGTIDHACRVFPAVRNLPFNEMEYAIPAEAWADCFRDLIALYHRPGFNVHFPVEGRWVAADDAMLSPAHDRDSAYFAVHQVAWRDHQAPFAEIEALFRRYGGRPHWGKLNTMTRENARAHYPRLPDFLALRERLDPQRTFSNRYLDGLLG